MLLLLFGMLVGAVQHQMGSLGHSAVLLAGYVAQSSARVFPNA
jgi:hypothetical protein